MDILRRVLVKHAYHNQSAAIAFVRLVHTKLKSDGNVFYCQSDYPLSRVCLRACVCACLRVCRSVRTSVILK